MKIDRTDPHTLSFEPRPVAYLPLPGGRTEVIPGLLSVQLPPGVHKGERYRLVVHQISGAKQRVIGSFQLEVPVFHEAELLEAESIKLALLRWVNTRIPVADPWRLIFDRYLGEIADRVRGFGGDPDHIRPSAVGEVQPPDTEEPKESLEGKVTEVRYDCFGDFTGFVLVSCDTRHDLTSCEPAVERVVVRACAERLRLRVQVDPGNAGRVLGLTVVCCASDSGTIASHERGPARSAGA